MSTGTKALPRSAAGSRNHKSAPVITLLSDFGTRDGYVGAMKGVLLSRCPAARLIDLSHEIEPGEIASGAWVLAQAAPHFPEGSVHLAVVDPGVGSERRALACEIDGRLYVAPDNGLLSGVLGKGRALRAHALTRSGTWSEPVSAVFHGRDVFAPVAAHLAGGGVLEDVGEPLDPDSLVRSASPGPRREHGALVGRVIHVDRFGNLITDLCLPEEDAGGFCVEIAGEADLPVARCYSDVAEGELLALVGSEGYLEVACNRDSAARRMRARVGHVVVLRPRRGA